MMTFALSLLAAAPAHAEVYLTPEVSPFQGVQANGLYATLGLFLLCVPGERRVSVPFNFLRRTDQITAVVKLFTEMLCP